MVVIEVISREVNIVDALVHVLKTSPTWPASLLPTLAPEERE